MLTFPPTQTASKGVVRGRSMPDMGPFVAPGHALRGRMGSKVEAHAYMESKGVPQLLDSVLKQLVRPRPLCISPAGWAPRMSECWLAKGRTWWALHSLCTPARGHRIGTL